MAEIHQSITIACILQRIREKEEEGKNSDRKTSITEKRPRTWMKWMYRTAIKPPSLVAYDTLLISEEKLRHYHGAHLQALKKLKAHSLTK